LIEVIVTLAVIGFALVLVTGYKPPWSRGLGLKGTAAELASGLRLARSEAIASNRSVSFDVDVLKHLYRVGTGKVLSLPPHMSIELLTIAGEKRQDGEGDILFNADGSSSGGRITLADGQRSMAVGVDWLTGRVSVTNVH
jgi:general secretion pathway protein H